MQRTAKIIDCYGQSGRLKIKRIREHEAAHAGKWIDGVFVFTRRADPVEAPVEKPRCKPVQSPTIGRIVSRVVDEFSGQDSGFSLLAYPQKSGGYGPDYGAFAKMGAGLC